MLTLYDKEHVKLRFLRIKKEYCIDSTLITGDKKLSFLLPKEEHIENEMYVHADGQEYVVKSITPSSDSWIKIDCNLNVEELEGKPFEKFETVEKTIKECLDFAFVGTGWIVKFSGVTKRRTIRRTNTTTWNILQDARKTYYAEIEIDSIAKTISIYEHLGTDKGAYFIDGLNIKKIDKQSTTYDFYTQILPKGKDGLTISTVNGGSEVISDFSYSEKEKLFIWTDQRYTVAQSLKDDALLKLKDLSKPLIALALDVVDLAKLDPKYSILDYSLGDTVRVISKSENVNEKTRIVKITKYPDEPIRNKCEIASSILKFEDLQQELQDAADTVSNITTSNGTVDGSKVDSITTNQISDFSVKVAEITDLTAINATVQNLIVSKASVQELNAVNARVGTLEATTITTTEFNAKIADIDLAIIGKASVIDMTAATAKIGILEADIGTIGTLLSGTVTSGSSQTIVLNAQNATIENALIKSAMIDSVAAGKLTAGTIDASSIHFKSKTGNMDIFDNTIAIRDANRVRVQIGKDATSDYNMYVWDNVGKLMFDATGLKADGIKSKIIRDDMVSDTANISGGKINIPSVVTEINNGTSTIKSSHILYDPTGQTLNVAFNSLTTSLDEIKTDYKSIKSMSMQFAVNTSSTIAPTTGWSSSMPERTPNQYLWARDIVTYSDDSTYMLGTRCITGDKGTSGTSGKDGVSIKTVASYFAINTSNTVAPTTGWATTPPTRGKGQYLWRKDLITLSDNSTSYTTPVNISGYDGSDGIQGAKGADGVSSYFFIRYSQNADGNPMVSTSANAIYIGVCVSAVNTAPTANTSYAWSLIKGAKGDKGDQGLIGGKGNDGVTYYTWLKYADTPTSGMSDEPTGKKYIGLAYNKPTATESTTYTDYAWTLVKGDKGDTGAVGGKGTDGKTYYTWIKYAINASGAGMSDDPTGKTYIGLAYNKVSDIESTVPADYAWSLIKGDKGDQGLQGLQGIKGTNGADGKTTYFHIKYSAVENPSAAQMSETPNTFIGTYVDTLPDDSTDPLKYTWARFQGLQGTAGTQGIPGKNGVDGKTTYLHIKYSNDGGKTFTANMGETVGTYLGTCTDNNLNDPTVVTSYTWALIKGDKGDVGIPGIKGTDGKTSYLHIKYSDNGTSFTANNGETPGKWLGTYVDFVEVDSTVFTAYSWVKTEGQQGASGKGVTSIIEQYYLSTSNTTQTGGSWTTTVPTWIDGKFIWTKSVITYTDATSSNTSPVCVTGSKGQTGTAGKGVSKVDVLYYLSTSNATQAGGSWVTTSPAWADGKFIWSKTVVTYTDGTTTETAPACITGSKGSTGTAGSNGTSVTKVEILYYLSSSNVEQLGGTWSTAAPTWVDGKYVWSKNKTTLSNSTIIETLPVCITGGKGQSGIDGVGIKSTEVAYQSSTSGTVVPTGAWTTSIPNVAANQYLWTRTTLTYSNNSTSISYSIGKIGANGATGSAGKGILSTAITYQASTSGTATPTGTWGTTIPTVGANQYLWTRTVITYTDSTTSTSYSIGKIGANGTNGATGTSVTSITNEYYLSTSKTAQAGGSWVAVPPAWASGKYIWTRSKIIYANPASTVYTVPLCDSAWEAANDVKSELNGTITTLTGRVSASETSLSAANGKISTLISDTTQIKQDVKTVQGGLTTATGNISTLQSNYSSLNQTVSGINATVGSHTSTISTVTKTANDALGAINGLEIGGRNLITNTRPRSVDGWSLATATGTFLVIDEATAISGKAIKFTFNAIKGGGIHKAPLKRLTVGQKYVWSVYVKCNKNVTLSIGSEQGGAKTCSITTSWQKFTHTFTATDASFQSFVFYATGGSSWAVNDALYVHSLMLGEGTKPSAWSESPEDVENLITTEIKTVTDKQATFDLSLKGITGRVTSTETNINTISGKQSALEINLNQIKLNLEHTDSSIYRFETGHGNIFNDCNQTISKDKNNKAEVSLSTMPLGIAMSYMRNKDICISVNVQVVNALKALSNIVGAEFSITYTDNTVKKYSSYFVPGEFLLDYFSDNGTMSIDKRISSCYKIDDKDVKAVSNLKLIISCNADSATVSNPKVEFGTLATGFEFDMQDVRDNITTVSKGFSTIEQKVESISLQSVSLTQEVTTIKGDVNSVQTRLNSTELKLTPTAITAMINEKIGADGALQTTKFTMNRDGLSIHNGGFKIYNKANQIVLGADTNGNLSVTGGFTSLGAEGTKLVMGNGRNDFFINESHCGVLAAANTSSTSRGITMCCDTSARFISFGQMDINGQNGASYYTMNFGLNPNGWTERHIFSDTANFLQPPRYGAGYVVCSNITGSGQSNIKHIYHESASGANYLHYNPASGGEYYLQSTWLSDEKLKHGISNTKVDALNVVRSIKHKEFSFNENGIKRNIGYIAQDLEKLDSQMVVKLNGTLTINQELVIPYISKGLQELDKIVSLNELKNVREILEMKQRYDNEIADLKMQICELKGKLLC